MFYSMIITKNANMSKPAMADMVNVAIACPDYTGSNNVDTHKCGTTDMNTLLERAIFVRT